ncbi:hypothetical protein AVEN_233063-1 [Araneus ventricosus]|uniref:Uncharacterized protein n=1 Tax=Araneus ventricosus TaxID=182803 RepID=A0A4Y2DNU1_ARAVE|nr:hypothetical protein AVEN_233063-1 [Araneus ventricosus]
MEGQVSKQLINPARRRGKRTRILDGTVGRQQDLIASSHVYLMRFFTGTKDFPDGAWLCSASVNRSPTKESGKMRSETSLSAVCPPAPLAANGFRWRPRQWNRQETLGRPSQLTSHLWFFLQGCMDSMAVAMILMCSR